MGIGNTLRDIADEETHLGKNVKFSLREIAKEYDKLEAKNERLKEAHKLQSERVEKLNDLLNKIQELATPKTMASQCAICGNEKNYNFGLNIGLCDACILNRLERIEAKNERLEDALRKIQNWARAYPLQIFPKPDLKKAARILKAEGMTLDAISADAMRHVIKGVSEIVEQGLKENNV